MDKEKYNYIKAHTLYWEGGYAQCSDGSDYSCTMRGLSIDLFRKYYGKDKTCNDLKVVSEKEWDYVFQNEFYNVMQCDKIRN